MLPFLPRVFSRVLELLLENGADANVRDEFSTASRMAAQRRVSSARGESVTPCLVPLAPTER